MNKTAIKNFAIWARVQLIEAAKQKAFEYEIIDGGETKTDIETVGGKPLSKAENKQRKELISQIRSKGFNQVMEQAAYTWFNRFIALRYMEVNGYLPSKVRLFTDENGAFKPEILKEAINADLNGIDRSKVIELIDKQDNEELYKYLLITQCNALNTALPGMFEKIENWTELLFPANLLRTDSVLARMVSDIPEEDWTDQVQIIGWLYQYYNAEPKDKVFENLKKNIKISKENIPAATQLFTPDWIVRYMVENSLGRLWVEGHPNDELKANWKYYLEEAEQKPEVQAQLSEIRKEYAALKPEEIKVIDPCMGSGHILVYMFDVLVQIYESYGHTAREAAGLILQNNLYGLDIDERAAQLAYFAVMMKARQYDRRIFSRGIQPHVYAIVESNGISNDILTYFENGNDDLKKAMETIVCELHDAKEYGSILNVTQVNFAALYARLDEIKEDISLFATAAQAELRPIIEVAEAMAQKYYTVVTNPPYAGAAGLNSKLCEFLKKHYDNAKGDLFATFIEKCASMAYNGAFIGMITQQAWMSLNSYENLRKKILYNYNLETMIHLGNGAFGFADFGLVGFTYRKKRIPRYRGKYFRLIDSNNPEWKETAFLARINCYCAIADNFEKIPGFPVAYWASEAFYSLFNEGTPLGNIADSKQGLATADNNRFVREWHEVALNTINFCAKSVEDAALSGKKWFPYNKGGEFRKWYGNNEFVVNWEKDGYEIKHFTDDRGKLRSRPQNTNFYFRPSGSWSDITSGTTAFRYKPQGHIFDITGMSFFSDEKLYYLIALCNTRIALEVLKVVAPTIHCQCGDVANIPVMFNKNVAGIIDQITKENIEYSRTDWDSFETSWDFLKHPLI